jgi:hypothetical protein
MADADQILRQRLAQKLSNAIDNQFGLDDLFADK